MVPSCECNGHWQVIRLERAGLSACPSPKRLPANPPLAAEVECDRLPQGGGPCWEGCGDPLSRGGSCASGRSGRARLARLAALALGLPGPCMGVVLWVAASKSNMSLNLRGARPELTADLVSALGLEVRDDVLALASGPTARLPAGAGSEPGCPGGLVPSQSSPTILMRAASNVKCRDGLHDLGGDSAIPVPPDCDVLSLADLGDSSSSGLGAPVRMAASKSSSRGLAPRPASARLVMCAEQGERPGRRLHPAALRAHQSLA
mmetsp:Transcript_80372/g.236468  ORF Transcript_80372/g.236468 Transcript_80372/m.236468 type:complete len:262 (+) Transcript_80372:669-1454(+)